MNGDRSIHNRVSMGIRNTNAPTSMNTIGTAMSRMSGIAISRSNSVGVEFCVLGWCECELGFSIITNL